MAGMDNQAPTGVLITFRELYDELTVLRTELRDATSALKSLGDHETRIRQLERWKYALPASLIASLASLIAALVVGR